MITKSHQVRVTKDGTPFVKAITLHCHGFAGIAAPWVKFEQCKTIPEDCPGTVEIFVRRTDPDIPGIVDVIMEVFGFGYAPDLGSDTISILGRALNLYAGQVEDAIQEKRQTVVELHDMIQTMCEHGLIHLGDTKPDSGGA